MTRKDYEAIAAVLARQFDAQQQYGTPCVERLNYVAQDLAEVFAKDNPRFDTGRFMRATRA